MPNVRHVALRGNLQDVAVNIAAAQTTTIATPTSGKRFHLVGLLLVPAASMTVQPVFGSTAKTGVMTIVSPGIWLPPVPTYTGGAGGIIPIWTGAVDEAFKLITAAATQLSGFALLMEDDPT